MAVLTQDDLLEEHKSWHARARFRAATAPGGIPADPAQRPVLVVAH